jgi:hypothetical protein
MVVSCGRMSEDVFPPGNGVESEVGSCVMTSPASFVGLGYPLFQVEEDLMPVEVSLMT